VPLDRVRTEATEGTCGPSVVFSSSPASGRPALHESLFYISVPRWIFYSDRLADVAAQSAIASGSQHSTMSAGWPQIPAREPLGAPPCVFRAGRLVTPTGSARCTALLHTRLAPPALSIDHVPCPRRCQEQEHGGWVEQQRNHKKSRPIAAIHGRRVGRGEGNPPLRLFR
jgi:hypothetical protein